MSARRTFPRRSLSARPFRVWALALVAPAVVALTAAPAGATEFAGSMSAPQGRIVGGVIAAVPGREADAGSDIIGLHASFDDQSGTIRANLTYAATPTFADVATVTFGRRDSTGACRAPAAVLLANNAGPDTVARWSRSDVGDASAASGAAQRSLIGAVLTVGATDGELAGQTYDCAEAHVSAGGGAIDTVGPVALRVVAGTETGPYRSGPETRMRAPGIGTLALNRWKTLRVRIGNVGGDTAENTRLQVRVPAGMEVRLGGVKASRSRQPTRKLGLLLSGRTKHITVKVRATRKAADSGQVRFRLTAQGLPTQTEFEQWRLRAADRRKARRK